MWTMKEKAQALYANLLTCVFLQVPSLSCVKEGDECYLFTSFSIKYFTLFYEAPSIRTIGSRSLVYIMLCNFQVFISLTLSVLHQTIFLEQQNCINFICRLNNILFMWPILYFLILFISYCSVQYYSSSIYRYILVKRNRRC